MNLSPKRGEGGQWYSQNFYRSEVWTSFNWGGGLRDLVGNSFLQKSWFLGVVEDSLLRYFFLFESFKYHPPLLNWFSPLNTPEALIGTSLRTIETPMGHL